MWKHHRAQRDVAALALALEIYAKEQGDYPTGDAAQIAALLRGESRAGQNAKRLDYIEVTANETNTAGALIDPWGTPYRLLMNPGRAYSVGPNRRDEQGAGDDIRSWR